MIINSIENILECTPKILHIFTRSECLFYTDVQCKFTAYSWQFFEHSLPPSQMLMNNSLMMIWKEYICTFVFVFWKNASSLKSLKPKLLNFDYFINIYFILKNSIQNIFLIKVLFHFRNKSRISFNKILLGIISSVYSVPFQFFPFF